MILRGIISIIPIIAYEMIPNITLAKLTYFTKLDFPEIRGPISLPLRYLLGGFRSRVVAMKFDQITGVVFEYSKKTDKNWSLLGVYDGLWLMLCFLQRIGLKIKMVKPLSFEHTYSHRTYVDYK